MSTPDSSDDERRNRSPTADEAAGDDQTMVVYEFAVPTGAFALERALGDHPDAVVELEPIVPRSDRTAPYLWVTGGHCPAFREAVESDPTVARVRRVVAFDRGALYEVEWDEADAGFFGICADAAEDAVLLRARARGDEWVLKFRFRSRAALSAFRDRYREAGVDPRVVSLYDLTDPELGQYDITEKQRTALLRALEMGHFDIPREATLEDVADSLGISPKALSERLRRGKTNLLGNTLAVGSPAGVGLDDRPAVSR
ncbi:helix-turn-helix domain-containing protein [Halosimplex pelagicum]|uniref:Helix-turn-helix domain-containing protein n=1 Tax=Halosimplex pelagicum TaxID=869886 RepID=A0A7D5ST21_9EURY|nr:helix-turn-helix domain-containing protein [Halosimplex pelagicum]QLH80127.1 helix-turn-helix domain-containing protein [Halosimplex pelagicum]